MKDQDHNDEIIQIVLNYSVSFSVEIFFYHVVYINTALRQNQTMRYFLFLFVLFFVFGYQMPQDV